MCSCVCAHACACVCVRKRVCMHASVLMHVFLRRGDGDNQRKIQGRAIEGERERGRETVFTYSYIHVLTHEELATKHNASRAG